MSTCNRLDLQTIGSQLVMMPKNLPDQWSRKASKAMIGKNRQLFTDEPVEFRDITGGSSRLREDYQSL